MVTSKGRSVQTQQPYQTGDVLEQLVVILDEKAAKKIQDISDALSSYQVVVNEATDIYNRSLLPA